jgi:hypothetical protein
MQLRGHPVNALSINGRENRIAIHYTILHLLLLMLVGTWHCLTHRQYDSFSLMRLLQDFVHRVTIEGIVILYLAIYAVIIIGIHLFQWIGRKPFGFSYFSAGIICLSISAICLLNDNPGVDMYYGYVILLAVVGFILLLIASIKSNIAISVYSAISIMGNGVLLFLLLFMFGYWIPFIHLIIPLCMYVVGAICFTIVFVRRFFALHREKYTTVSQP